MTSDICVLLDVITHPHIHISHTHIYISHTHAHTIYYCFVLDPPAQLCTVTSHNYVPVKMLLWWCLCIPRFKDCYFSRMQVQRSAVGIPGDLLIRNSCDRKLRKSTRIVFSGAPKGGVSPQVIWLTLAVISQETEGAGGMRWRELEVGQEKVKSDDAEALPRTHNGSAFLDWWRKDGSRHQGLSAAHAEREERERTMQVLSCSAFIITGCLDRRSPGHWTVRLLKII